MYVCVGVDVWMCGGGMTSVFLTSWLRPCRQCIQIITFSFFFFFFYSTFLQNPNFYQITTEPRIHGEQYETLTSFRDARSAIGWWITRVPSNGESEPSWSRLLGTRCEVSYWTPGSVSQPARPPRLGCSAPLKMLNWWAYGAVQWKKEGEPPVFFFVTLFHCRHTQKRNRTTTQNWTMLFPSGVGAARGFLLLLPGAQLGFLPARGGDKRVGRCYCGVLKGKKLLME